ncbi:hypothetical protein ACHAW5_003276 [Stephanodiscus triporus]|uniref:Transcription initiation factor TFIID subunit 12 domain-containing protein n=1 Tax=Stephanodiscus triporus TaxID=2934178 RepID=A0ABD3NTG3_9STRA
MPNQPPTVEATPGQITEDSRRWNDGLSAGMPPILQASNTVGAQPFLGPLTQQMLIPPPLQQQALLPTAYAPPQVQTMPPQHQPLVPNAPSLYHQQQPQQQVPTPTPAQMQQQLAQMPLVALQSNASLNAVIHQAVPQPTKRPGWSESRLSAMNTTAGDSSAKKSSIADTGRSTPTRRKADNDGYGKPSLAPMLGEKLQALCHSIDPSYTLDSEVQERLLEMTDAFLDKVTRDSIKLARHRGSTCMDVVDVALALKKGFNMEVPGLGPPSVANGGSARGEMIGGWLFADKVNLGVGRSGEGAKRPSMSKKRRASGGSSAAAAAAM